MLFVSREVREAWLLACEPAETGVRLQSGCVYPSLQGLSLPIASWGQIWSPQF
jgi:hypothetical protein